MPEALFFQLEEDKRKRIIEAGVREFADQSYSDASTNHLVKVAGISKGSLFKYFAHKEDLYFYLLDQVIAELMAGLNDEIASLKGDLFQVILDYAEAEFTWHMENPVYYRFMKRAFTHDSTDIWEKTRERYKITGESMYEQLLADMDTGDLRWEKHKTIKLVRWILEGYNQEFMKDHDSSVDLLEMKEAYIRELKEYIEMIKTGLQHQIIEGERGENTHV